MEAKQKARLTWALREYAFHGADVSADIRSKYGFDGDMLGIYAGNTGPVVHKWHHYIPIYDRYFGPMRGRKLRFLEIGVSKGGSLQMWREYFGPDMVLFGIDIDPDCAAFDGQAGQVRIGSQDDPAFLRDVVAEMGGVDIVLDDGSHQMQHLRDSMNVLFPLLSNGGVYAIEDLHTAYWPRFGGGYTRDSNFFTEVRSMIDDMHHWYHDHPPHDPARAAWVTGIHVHDSIAVIEKGQVHPPTHSKVGK